MNPSNSNIHFLPGAVSVIQRWPELCLPQQTLDDLRRVLAATDPESLPEEDRAALHAYLEQAVALIYMAKRRISHGAEVSIGGAA
jgi:hypothetical protein